MYLLVESEWILSVEAELLFPSSMGTTWGRTFFGNIVTSDNKLAKLHEANVNTCTTINCTTLFLFVSPSLHFICPCFSDKINLYSRNWVACITGPIVSPPPLSLLDYIIAHNLEGV